ncbi:MAG: hypothetical protein MUF11_00865 [Beijerinckiaceae bacterium]|nr:hypothetical protein [Beijerinckiaceae bacterium]
MRGVLILASFWFLGSAACAAELSIKCGAMNGYSTFVATELRPAELRPDALLNGSYRFVVSSSRGLFRAFFESAESVVERKIDDSIVVNGGNTIVLRGKNENVEQKFYINVVNSRFRMVYVSEVKMLSGEIQLGIYAADCQKTG